MSGFDERGESSKAEGAMLSIGELADRIGVPTHVLRYWETRFPELRPLQRSGRRRYYRPADVALAERIHHLLHVKGVTVEGARKALSGREAAEPAGVPASSFAATAPPPVPSAAGSVPVAALVALRQRLAAALGAA